MLLGGPAVLRPCYGMSMAKVTFSVDDATVRVLKETAERLGKPQSMVVREAVAEYAARAGELTESERKRMLRIVDAMIKEAPSRSASAVTAEIRDIRRARQQSGRRRSAGDRTG
jgi:predicted transcriptional regulator